MRMGEVQKIKAGNNLTQVTMQKLTQIARQQRTDPTVRRTVENLLQNVPEKNWKREIETIFNFVKSSIRYTRDVNDVEYVKTPYRHLSEKYTYGISYGDCDDMSLLLATLLNSAGYKTKFVIIRTPTNPLPTYNHIYVEVLEPATRTWIALDPTMKSKPFGWKPPRIFSKEYIV